jgi:prepilin-type N-terminal cleavage/methylation domain-containing protein
MKKSKPKNNKAFTLIETIIAIFILVIAVTGPMAAAQNSLKASFLARDQVVAFYLAQDVIEYVKNQRDRSVLGSPSKKLIDSSLGYVRGKNSNTYKIYSIDSSGSSSNCDTINPNNNTISDAKETGSCANPLKRNNDGYFRIDGNDDTKYRRLVSVKEIRDDEYEIVVEVMWDQNLFLTERKVTVQENIFDWLPIN